jgi:two-component system cell cycle response regulator
MHQSVIHQKVRVMSTRILIVDDEIDTLNLLSTLLELSGYTPIATLNSVEAIAIADAEKPDVVLLDIMMPVLDGFTLCKMMRANPMTKNLPIIFVTAYSLLDLKERQHEAGADWVVHKPIDIDDLMGVIQDAQKIRAMRSHQEDRVETASTSPAEIPATSAQGHSSSAVETQESSQVARSRGTDDQSAGQQKTDK